MPILPQRRSNISGAACCLIAALAYTASNICMRQLTTLHCDPSWAVFNREFVTTALVGSWLLYQAICGRPTLPSGHTLLRLLAAGLILQVVGNIGAQWALGVVGLSVTVPAFFGIMLTSGAAMAHAWLGERISFRSVGAIVILLAALVLLGMGTESVARTIADVTGTSSNSLVLAVAVAAAGLAGATSALLSITIRHSVTRTALPTAVAFLVPLVGVVSLGPPCVWRLGPQTLLSTPWEQVALMVAAGSFNLIGFLAFINGLQRTTVAHANMVSASQVAMAALAGILLFHEPPNPWILLGIVLTIAGILRFDRPADGGGV